MRRFGEERLVSCCLEARLDARGLRDRIVQAVIDFSLARKFQGRYHAVGVVRVNGFGFGFWFRVSIISIPVADSDCSCDYLRFRITEPKTI